MTLTSFARNKKSYTKIFNLFDFFVVALLSLQVIFLVRPLLEGYGKVRVLDSLGIIDGLKYFVKANVDRPFEDFPNVIGYFIFPNSTIGIKFIYILALTSRYLILRFLTNARLGQSKSTFISCTFAFSPLWLCNFYFESLAQNVAATILVIAIVFVNEKVQNDKRGLSQIAIVILILIGLLIYQALFTLLIASSIYFWKKNKNLTITYAILIYIFYYFAIRMLIDTQTYNDWLLSGQLAIYSPIKLILKLYEAVYLQDSLTCVFLLFLYVVFLQLKIQVNSRFLYLIIFVAPFSSVLYFMNFYFISDIRRITYPFSFAVYLIAYFLLCEEVHKTKNERSKSSVSTLKYSFSLVVVILQFLSVAKYMEPIIIQNKVLNSFRLLSNQDTFKDSKVLIMDNTGLLGDVFTFSYPDTFELAVKAFSGVVEARICVTDVSRWNRPVLTKVESTLQLPLCSTIDQSHFTKILDLNNEGNLNLKLTIK